MMASNVPDSISAFTAAVPQSTFSPDSPEYQAAATYWTDTVSLKPSCFFIPKSAEELAKGLREIVKNQIPFSVKGGGHATIRGWSGIDGKASPKGGITISTAALKSLELDQKQGEGASILRAGVGNTLSEIYDFLDGKGITIAAGSQATPGIGGLFLGGCTGPYWNRFGFSVNQVANFQVVVASGEVLEVNAQSHSDLYFALKGGLSNFGVVTRMEFRTFPTETLWTGAHIIAPHRHEAAFEAYDSFTASEGDNQNAFAMLMSPAKGVLMAGMFYDGPHASEDPPDVFQKLHEIPRINSTFKPTDWRGIVKFSFQIGPYGFRRYISTTTIRKDTKLLQRLFELYQSSATENLGHVEGIQTQISGLVMTVTSLRKNNDSPLAVKGNDDLIGMMQLTTWKQAEDDDKVMRWTENITEEMDEMARKENKLHGFRYINNINAKQDAFSGYEPENVERMREVSRKYDPDRVFQDLRKGGPKLWN